MENVNSRVIKPSPFRISSAGQRDNNDRIKYPAKTEWAGKTGAGQDNEQKLQDRTNRKGLGMVRK
jgi:hypothetical protein